MKVKVFKKLKFSFLFTIFVIITSCNIDDNIDCTTALPAPDWFEIGFVNAQGDPLIGSVYQQDEFRVFNANSEVFVSPVPFGNPTRLQFRYNDFVSNIEYYIELTEIDTDTLKFIYTSSLGPCFINYNLQQVIYNDQTIQVQNSNIVELLKEN